MVLRGRMWAGSGLGRINQRVSSAGKNQALIVGDGGFMVWPRRGRDFDDPGCGGLVAGDAGCRRRYVEGHIDSAVVKRRGHDVVF